MELMEGELFEEILNWEKFDEAEAREAIKSIIAGISYCHDQNIIHRDIKPENLLLKSKEVGISSLKIADFGLARPLETGTLAGTTCGTPGYIAPEIVLENPYGKECDYWSIGVVAFILLSGAPPFYDEDNFKLFDKIKTCDYTFDEKLWQNVSLEARDFITKIFVVDPK